MVGCWLVFPKPAKSGFQPKSRHEPIWWLLLDMRDLYEFLLVSRLALRSTRQERVQQQLDTILVAEMEKESGL